MGFNSAFKGLMFIVTPKCAQINNVDLYLNLENFAIISVHVYTNYCACVFTGYSK